MSAIYQVVFAPEAKESFEAAYRWISERSPRQANSWADGFMQAIATLERMPSRCPLAPESVFFDQEIRQLLFGKRGHTYRALFTFEHSIVNVLYIRHYAQDWVRPDQ